MSQNRTNQMAASTTGTVYIQAARSGDWLPAETFRDMAVQAVQQDSNIVVNLADLNHLDTSALQVLLAMAAELMKRGNNLGLINASPELRQWFELSGAKELLINDGAMHP